MKVFVTGATGFIGRRLVEKLNNDGIEVVALVRKKRHELPEGVQIVRGNILEKESFGNAGQGCDYLYHLAAMITFDARKREELIRVNGEGTLNMLKAARDWNIKRSIIVSSACTIGLSFSPNYILNENSPFVDELANQNPYLESKLSAEKAAIELSKKQDVVIVNPSTVYGAGDYSLNSGTLILKIARSGILPVPGGGSNVVDVDDVINGILAAAEKGQCGRRYILGGSNLTFSEIFSVIADVVNHRPKMIPVSHWMRVPMSAAAGIAGRLMNSRFITPQIIKDMFAFKYYSSERAKKELGWHPVYTFKESVRRAWDFYRKEKIIL